MSETRTMQRNEWTFEYTAGKLSDAASAKMRHHGERVRFWKSKREEVLATIRAEGLEIDEKLVLGFQTPKSRDWERANRVTVRDDLRQHLDECLDKLRFHTDQLSQSDGWQQVLAANAERRVALTIDDWLFFFGRDGMAPAPQATG